MQFISTKTEMHDWTKAQGTYMAEGGNYIISIGMDNRYDFPPYFENKRLNGLITDIRQNRSFWVHAYINNNTAVLHTSNYSLDAFITLNADGTITASDTLGAYGVDMTGTYTRISVHTPPLPAKIEFSWPETDFWTTDEGYLRYIGFYVVPTFTGLGDSDFDAYVSAHITDVITMYYESFASAVNDRCDDSYFFAGLNIVTVSDFYYAVAAYADWYISPAAHGATEMRVFNIDADKGKILTLDDIFKPGYRPVLEGILSDMAQTSQYADLLYTGTTTIELTENVQFFLSDTRIVVIFPTYEIGPYTSGIIRFSVPFIEISEYLLPEYQQGNLMREIRDEDLFRDWWNN
jgi:hypothetical protein